MMKKKVLSEIFFIKENISNLKFINSELIKSHILTEYNIKNYYNNNVYWYLNNYLKLNYHRHIQFINDYVGDYYAVNYDKTLVLTDNYGLRALVCKTNESITTHNSIQEYDLNDTPDLDLIYTVSSGKIPSYLTFQYENGRDKHKLYRIPLEQGCYILFNSHINRYITKNENDENLINLSLHFKLL